LDGGISDTAGTQTPKSLRFAPIVEFDIPTVNLDIKWQREQFGVA